MATQSNLPAKSAVRALFQLWVPFVLLLGFSTPAQAGESAKAEGAFYVELEPLTVNLQDSRYLRVKIALKVADSKRTESIKYSVPVVYHSLILQLSNHKAGDFSTAQGKQKIMADIKAVINNALDLKPGEVVADVLLMTFVIQ